jgi:hypothetical protein
MMISIRSLPVLKKGKVSGEVKCDLHYFPCNVADKSEDGIVIPPADSSKFNIYMTQNCPLI